MNIFIAGCPRSGTTALTRLVNLHPDIVVGMERFKSLYGKRREFSTSLFEAERFFDFRDADSNYVPAKNEEAAVFYAKAREKFATAQFIGDKYPQFYRHYDSIFRNYPDAKVLFIFRDPAFVAQSWQRRAEDGTSWPSHNDGKKAVTYWNDSLAYTLAYTQIKRHNFILVDYEEFFGGREDALVALLRRLGARMTPEVEAQLRADAAVEFGNSGEILTQKLDLPKDVDASVKNVADRNLLRRAKRVLEAQRASAPGQAAA